MEVANLQLETYEYQTPNIVAAAGSLWSAGGHWVRGSFPVDVQAQDPSGVCRLLVKWKGQALLDTGERALDPTYWDQCDPGHDGSWQNPWPTATVNTADAVPTDATGVPLEADGDFAINDDLTPTPPNPCTTPVLLIRTTGGTHPWFAAGIPD